MARIQVIVPDELLSRVDAIVQRASRSAWVVAAIEAALPGEKPEPPKAAAKPVGASGGRVEGFPVSKPSAKAAIRALVLKTVGDRRMTERELAKELGMPEMKLSKVLMELVADGDLRYDRGLVVAA